MKPLQKHLWGGMQGRLLAGLGTSWHPPQLLAGGTGARQPRPAPRHPHLSACRWGTGSSEAPGRGEARQFLNHTAIHGVHPGAPCPGNEAGSPLGAGAGPVQTQRGDPDLLKTGTVAVMGNADGKGE